MPERLRADVAYRIVAMESITTGRAIRRAISPQ
jgi:hypothetical protein